MKRQASGRALPNAGKFRKVANHIINRGGFHCLNSRFPKIFLQAQKESFLSL
jgi:hypothetical protein